MFHRSPSTSGCRRAWIGRALPLLFVGMAGCMYSFTGGGLPRHIDTIAVLPFENETTQPLLGSDLRTSIEEELPRSLGVRLVEETVADAVVRGRITGFSESAQNVRPGDEDSGAQVFQREVRISFQAEIFDRVENRVIWQASSSGVGTYRPDQEDFTAGKELAIEDLVRRVIEGAQSQW